MQKLQKLVSRKIKIIFSQYAGDIKTILVGGWYCVAFFHLRHGRINNLTQIKKLNKEFCLFFTDMTYVPGKFFAYIFLVTEP